MARERTCSGFLYMTEKSKELLFFHVFTRYDVSAFWGKVKKSAWQTWNVCGEASGIFNKRGRYPLVVGDEDLKISENFVVMMYDRYRSAGGVDDPRSAKADVKRATYQAGCIWIQSTIHQRERQTPANRGWIKTGDLLSGQSSHPLQRVVSSWPSIDTSQNAVVDANTTVLV